MDARGAIAITHEEEKRLLDLVAGAAISEDDFRDRLASQIDQFGVRSNSALDPGVVLESQQCMVRRDSIGCIANMPLLSDILCMECGMRLAIHSSVHPHSCPTPEYQFFRPFVIDRQDSLT